MAFGYDIDTDLKLATNPMDIRNATVGAPSSDSYQTEEGIAKSSIMQETPQTAARDNIISAGANAEGALAMGVASASTQMAIDSSVGVGSSKDEVAQATADFAREAKRAVGEHQTLDQVRYVDPNLSYAAQQDIYEQVAHSQGTSSQEIEQKAEAARQADMQAVQGSIMGLGLGGALDNMTGQAQTAPTQEKTAFNPFADLLKGFDGPKLEVADMGQTTAALANNQSLDNGLGGVGAQQRETALGRG